MYNISFDITGQVAVITGAGGIICGTMARELAKKGVKVALLDLFVESAQKIADEINANGGEAIAVGTTSVRTLESLYYIGVLISRCPDATEEQLRVTQWMPYEEDNNRLTTLEALQHILDYLDRHELRALHTNTQIMIAPGYTFHIVKRIVTNFHQPKSTLLLLVSAFVKGDWRKIYDYALGHDFRFLSYGDSSLLVP